MYVIEVGNYRIVGQLGVGGMGTVYRAEHMLIGRQVAVKLLHSELTANRDVVTRFFNEARATSAIKHPGIVEIFDFGYTPENVAYIVMELLEGEPLQHRMKARRVHPEADAVLLMRDVCSALAAAHAKGIVHRDLKPDNIFLVPDPELGERTKLLDFGIAKLIEPGLAGSATKTGAVMGTPTYMSPEQCKGTGNVDHRADLYAIGCMLYELVTGRPPFIQTGAGELIGSHLFVEPEPPSRHAQVSPDLEALIMTLLAKDPARRVQTARELGDRLLGIAQQLGAPVRMSAGMSYPPYAPASYTPSQQHYTPSQQHYTPAQQHYTPAQPHYTPSPPAHYTPAHHTPHHTPRPASQSQQPYVAAGPGALTVAASQKPTTLSGSASETAPQPRGRSRAVLLFTGLAAVGIGVGVFIALNTGGGSSAATPAANPHIATPPTTNPPSNDSPTADKPSTDNPTADKPSTDKPIAATAKPSTDEPTTAKPSTDKPIAATIKKPTKKPDKKPDAKKPDTKKPTKDGDLLETDL